MRVSILASLACGLVAVTAGAADITVQPGQSIQTAIGSAANGDRVLVQPGTYFEAIDFVGKDIQVIGVGGASVTTLDGTGKNKSVVAIRSGEPATATLQGFRVTHGTGFPAGTFAPTIFAAAGGGIAVIHANATIADCVIEDNKSIGGFGGGGLFEGATLLRCTLRNNLAAAGGGAFSGTCKECIIELNTAQNGGGVYFAKLRNCIVRDNVATAGSGGGGFADDVEDTLFENNVVTTSNGAGGALIRTLYAQPIRVVRCRFVGNTADLGAAIFVQGATNVELTDSEFVGNYSNYAHGAVYATATHVAVSGCRFRNNSAVYATAAIDITTPNSVTFENCTFQENFGPGIPSVRVAAVGVATVVRHCTFVGDALVQTDGNLLDIAGSIFDGHPNPIMWSGVLAIADSLAPAGITGPGVFSGTPGFVDEIGGDLHLTAGSPCIGAVSAAFANAHDYENDPRGTVADAGADEFAPHLALHGGTTIGGPVLVRLFGAPGDPAYLFLSPALLPAPISTQYGPFALGFAPLIGPIGLGVVPANGAIDLAGYIPGGTPEFTTIYAQAVLLGASNVLTNVQPIIVK